MRHCLGFILHTYGKTRWNLTNFGFITKSYYILVCVINFISWSIINSFLLNRCFRTVSCLQHSPNTSVSVCGTFSSPLELLTELASFWCSISELYITAGHINNFFTSPMWMQSKLQIFFPVQHHLGWCLHTWFQSHNLLTVTWYRDIWRPVSHFLLSYVNFVSLRFLHQNRQ